jgi:hypothetical protein
MLCKEMIPVYAKNHFNYCKYKMQLLTVKAHGIYSSNWA